MILDAGCFDPDHNTAHLNIRDHEDYTGAVQDRVTMRSPAGTVVNKAYYGEVRQHCPGLHPNATLRPYPNTTLVLLLHRGQQGVLR